MGSDCAVRKPLGLPNDIHLTLTGACNLRCRICRPEGLPVTVSTLPRDIIERVIDEVFDSLALLRLDSGGELLLSKDLDYVLGEASRRQIPVSVYTNGTLLTREHAERFCRSSVTDIHISLDSPVRETLEWIRDRARLEDIERNVADLVACRNALGQTRPRIDFHAAVMRQNLHELPDLIRLAARLGIDSVSFNYIGIHNYMDPAWAVYWERDACNDVLREVRWLGEDLGVQVATPRPFGTGCQPGGECEYLFEKTYIHSDGTVFACCVNWYPLGNLRESTLAEIWHGDRYAQLRATYRSEHPVAPKCSACHMIMGWNPDDYSAHFHPDHWPLVQRHLAEGTIPPAPPRLGGASLRDGTTPPTLPFALANQRIVIFGAGEAGRSALSLLGKAGLTGQVVAVCDNDPAKADTAFAGHRVTRFDRLQRGDYDRVIIASEPGRIAIARQLEEAGLTSRRDFATVAFVAETVLRAEASAPSCE